MTTPSRHWRQSIEARIVVLFLGLLLAVQLAGFVALRASLVNHAHRVLPTQLEKGERLLKSLLDREAQALMDGARLLATDAAFRASMAAADRDSIASLLRLHGERVGTTQAALLTADFLTRASAALPARDLAPAVSALQPQARRTGHASGVALLGGRPHQVVLVPVRSSEADGWLLLGFPLDGLLMIELKRLSGLDLTVLSRAAPSAPWTVTLSGVEADEALHLARAGWKPTPASEADDNEMTEVDAGGHRLGVRMAALGARLAGGSTEDDTGGTVLALLSLSVDDAVQLPTDLQWSLAVITAVAIVVFGIGCVLTARRLTRPLRNLADAAERLGEGDFSTPMHSRQRSDELGELSRSFERMRERVADNQAQVLKLAYWDSLTGLPNRVRFRDEVNRAVREADEGTKLAVVMLDLDRFKHVNDMLGYRVGDLMLIAVAKRLSGQLRGGDVVARLGGDEFALLLRNADSTRTMSVVQRIERAFATPLSLDGHSVDMAASIGIACWPRHAEDGDTLQNRAEVALHEAKRRHAGPVQYEPANDAATALTLTLMTELRQAVDRHELRLYLQPKVALADGRLVGAEALVRWQHPTRGMVPPLQFIPFAEQTGFIRVLTRWVFEDAARQWQVLNAHGIRLVLSVNLSTRDLLDPGLLQQFAETLGRHGVASSAFCLEITESAIMDDPQRSQATLDALSAMGFRLSIDDFGTGYSSLAYLKRLPVDELKIDQSFVRNMQTDADDAMIVRSTIDLAHNLGVKVVAEGVENAGVWDMLRERQCDEAQGWHMGRPMPATDLVVWAANWARKWPAPVAAVPASTEPPAEPARPRSPPLLQAVG